MTYVCRNCGNCESFSAWQEYTEWGREEIFFGGDGDIHDWGDRNATDSEGGDWFDIECGVCFSRDVEDIDDDMELERLQHQFPNREIVPDRVTPVQWKDKFGTGDTNG